MDEGGENGRETENKRKKENNNNKIKKKVSGTLAYACVVQTQKEWIISKRTRLRGGGQISHVSLNPPDGNWLSIIYYYYFFLFCLLLFPSSPFWRERERKKTNYYNRRSPWRISNGLYRPRQQQQQQEIERQCVCVCLHNNPKESNGEFRFL